MNYHAPGIQASLRKGAEVAFNEGRWCGAYEVTVSHDDFSAVNIFANDDHKGVTQSCDMHGEEAAWLCLLVAEYVGTDT